MASSVGYTQNLVKNPQFEEYYHLPDLKFEYNDRYRDSTFICKNWNRICGTTPDYFHVKSKNERYGIPDNFLGHNPAFIDSAYLGFVPITLIGSSEPIFGELIEPLEEGEVYEVSFVYRYARSACYFYLDKIELLFTKDLEMFKTIKSIPMYKDFIKPEIKANLVFDTLINDGEWNRLVGYYRAKGGEEYISFGIFYQDEKFNKIIDEYVSNNFILGQNPNREKGFYKKYGRELFIHQNSNFNPKLEKNDLQVNINIEENESSYISQERLSYYFIDDIRVIKITN